MQARILRLYKDYYCNTVMIYFILKYLFSHPGTGTALRVFLFKSGQSLSNRLAGLTSVEDDI